MEDKTNINISAHMKLNFYTYYIHTYVQMHKVWISILYQICYVQILKISTQNPYLECTVHKYMYCTLSPDDVIHQRDRCAGIQVTSTAVTYKRPNITL